MNCGRKKDSSPREKIKNQREIHSQDWENEKMRKKAFPNLGRTKNVAGCISNPSEERKTLKITRRS